MKFLILLLFPIASFAQFTLTPEGLRSSGGKDYVVINQTGKQADLYKAALLYIHKSYRSPKDVISSVEPEMITINGVSTNAIHRNALHVFDMNYTIVLEFKDDKIKINAPSFLLTAYNSQKQEMFVSGKGDALIGRFTIYNSKGKLTAEKAKEDLEKFFNSFIKQMDFTSKSDW